ncbi:MAG: DNA repair exonuclease [Firmicutes bacterium]|nr:DNA repair exonuclease [Bacillota bacterium]
MFTFIHCADLHLDSPLRGLTSKGGAPVEEIRSATRRAFEKMVSAAIDQEVQFVVIAGDVYDGDWQDYTTALFFNRQMARLRDRGIPVFLIQGNHDAASVISRQLTLPDNVQLLSAVEPETRVIEQFRVAIHGQGFAQRETRENLVAGFPNALPGYFNIGLLHTSAEGVDGHDRYAPCRVADLVAKGYDYWALGHIHQRRILNRSPWIVFPGNVQGRHIGETGAKGCMRVAVDDLGAVYGEPEFQELDVLRWVDCAVDVTGVTCWDGDLAQRLVSAWASERDLAYDGLKAVRVRLQGKTPLHGELTADTDRVEAEIINSLQSFVSGPLWIERVRIETADIDRTTTQQNDALQMLVEGILSLRGDDAFVDECLKHLTSMQNHLSDYIRSEGALCLQSREHVRSLLNEVSPTLVAKLQGGGGRA